MHFVPMFVFFDYSSSRGAEQFGPTTLGPRKGKIRGFRLGNGVLMFGIDTTTLIIVERCPRYLYIDLNPVRLVLTLYLLYVIHLLMDLYVWL